MGKENSKNLMKSLKLLLAAKGLKYKDISTQLGVSLPTVKRWFSGEGVSLEILLQLLAYSEHDLSDLAALQLQQEKAEFQYSLDQETFLADNPCYLAFFDQLLKGRHITEIVETAKISTRSVRRYLSKLEELGLIEVHLNDRIHLKVKGAPRWRVGGPLRQKLGWQAIQEFLEDHWPKGNVKLLIHNYLDDDLKQLQTMIEDVVSFSIKANQRAKAMKQTNHSHALLASLGVYSFSALTEITEL